MALQLGHLPGTCVGLLVGPVFSSRTRAKTSPFLQKVPLAPRAALWEAWQSKDAGSGQLCHNPPHSFNKQALGALWFRPGSQLGVQWCGSHVGREADGQPGVWAQGTQEEPSLSPRPSATKWDLQPPGLLQRTQTGKEVQGQVQKNLQELVPNNRR